MSGYKRKRSLQDSPVDLSKSKEPSQCLRALKTELYGIQETEADLEAIMEHVAALESILDTAKKPRLSFSVITKDELQNLGVTRDCLSFSSQKVAELASTLSPSAQVEVPKLHARILEIYEHVNMDFEQGSRMILLVDAILLSLAKIASDAKSEMDIAIFPGMRIAPGDEVRIVNRHSKYEVRLSGNIDYAVIQYEDVSDNKDRLLGRGGSREDALRIADGLLFLVDAKRQNVDRSSLASYVPEAVSQAIALMQLTYYDYVPFCLSDGQTWIFFILTSTNEGWTYYESAPRQLSKEALLHSDTSLCEIVQLMFEWLKVHPRPDLYEFE